MKRLILSALLAAVAFTGVGAVAEDVGARFKSDQKAMDIIAKARRAIGGDAALASVRSMVIKGQTTHTIKIDGTERTEQGETEIAFELPNRFSRMVKIGTGDLSGTKEVISDRNVVIVRKGGEPIELKGKDGVFTTEDGKTLAVISKVGPEKADASTGEPRVYVRRSGEGTAEFKTEDIEKIAGDGKEIIIKKVGPEGHGVMKHNEMLRMTLALLITAPEGLDVSYTYAGASDVDGTPVDIVAASAAGANFKLYFDRGTSLPVGMSYTGHGMPVVFRMHKKDAPTDDAKGTFTFSKQLENVSEAVEQFVRFSDFRNTNGILLPYTWTTTAAGAVREIFSVSAFELNPANIAERFKENTVMIRTPKIEEQK